MLKKNDELTVAGDDDLIFADETTDQSPEIDPKPWKLMIVDDDDEVHNITRMVLEDFSFEGNRLEFLNAYSGEEARRLIIQHPDTAIMLLDVVMENEHSGLDVVRFIREELKNSFVRIILRTGYPGQAPERKVIVEYDINDYKEKTDLTAQKLFTSITAALRSYRDLRTLEESRKGLEQIIDACGSLYRIQALKQFAHGVLTQLISILHLDDNSLYLPTSGFAAVLENDDYTILAGTGHFEKFIDMPLKDIASEEVLKDLQLVSRKKKSSFNADRFIGYFRTKNNPETLLYLHHRRPLSELEKNLIGIFSANVSIGFDNICLNQEIIDTQKEIILTLGEVVETRSRETANHVRRVAEYSHLLALKAGLDEEQAEILRQASPMHDVGKIGIPDTILNKPGRLTPEEFELIKAHAWLGYDILKNSNRRIMKAAAIVALQHHERWDGNGYPQGLKEEDIHVFGRITGIADVFDALSNNRIYKKAWEPERILDHIRKERGRHFDPWLANFFLESVDEFYAIQDTYPDELSSSGTKPFNLPER